MGAEDPFPELRRLGDTFQAEGFSPLSSTCLPGPPFFRKSLGKEGTEPFWGSERPVAPAGRRRKILPVLVPTPWGREGCTGVLWRWDAPPSWSQVSLGLEEGPSVPKHSLCFWKWERDAAVGPGMWKGGESGPSPALGCGVVPSARWMKGFLLEQGSEEGPSLSACRTAAQGQTGTGSGRGLSLGGARPGRSQGPFLLSAR